MATKTITIDLESYHRLTKAKRKDESFSEAIKRLVPMPLDFDAWLKKLEADPASDRFVEAVEEQISNRRKLSGRER